MSESKKWYAVYTNSHCEKKIIKILIRNKIESYYPLNRVHRKGVGPKKIVLEPLFTSYVFVKVSEAEHTLLKKIEGVVNLVYWLGKPAVISNVEIEMIKNIVSECTNVKLEKRPINFKDSLNDGLIIESECQGIGSKTRTIKIMLPSLGYIMQAEVETGSLKVIGSGISQHYEKQIDRYALVH